MNWFMNWWNRLRLWWIQWDIQLLEHQMEGMRHDLTEWKQREQALQLEIFEGEHPV